MSEPVFDPRHIMESVGDDGELAAELIQAYMEDAPLRMDALRAAIDAGDGDQAVRAAHSLKGMSGVVRSQELARLALDMEMTARAGDMAGVAERFPALEQTLETGLDEMGAFLESQG